MLPHALQQAQIDQGIDQSVEIGNRRSITQPEAFDAQLNRLAEDALYGGALLIDLLIGVALPVELAAQA